MLYVPLWLNMRENAAINYYLPRD